MAEFSTGFGKVPAPLKLEHAAGPGGNNNKVAAATAEAGTTAGNVRAGGSKGQGTHRPSTDLGGSWARPGRAGQGA